MDSSIAGTVRERERKCFCDVYCYEKNLYPIQTLSLSPIYLLPVHSYLPSTYPYTPRDIHSIDQSIILQLSLISQYLGTYYLSSLSSNIM